MCCLMMCISCAQVDQSQLDKLLGGDGTGPRSRFGDSSGGGSGGGSTFGGFDTGGSGGGGASAGSGNMPVRPLSSVSPLRVDEVGPPPSGPVRLASSHKVRCPVRPASAWLLVVAWPRLRYRR